mgnify:CR=1 FL=1
MQQPRRVFHLLLFASLFVLLLSAACSPSSSLTPTRPPLLHSAAELIGPFISPLPSGEKPPIGVVPPPGQRSVDPTWPFVAPDGRQLKLSQADAEAVAIAYARSLPGATADAGRIVALTYARLPDLGRDVLFISNNPEYPSLYHAIAVDLNSGERLPSAWIQNADVSNPWYTYVHGKFDEPLVAALERAQPNARLRVGVHAFPANMELVYLELARLYPEVLPSYFTTDSMLQVQEISADLYADMSATLARIYAARQSSGREPIVAWLQAKNAPTESFSGDIIWTELTPDQVLRLVHEEAVNLVRYYGPGDPNVLVSAPTPTPLADGWHKLPLHTLVADNSGTVLSWTPGQPTVWLMRDKYDVGGPAPLPESTWVKLRQLTFYSEAALVVHRGAKGGGCYSVRITDVATDSAALRVYADFYDPAPEEACPAAMVAPYHIVTLPAHDLPPQHPAPPIELIITTRTDGSWPP